MHRRNEYTVNTPFICNQVKQQQQGETFTPHHRRAIGTKVSKIHPPHAAIFDSTTKSTKKGSLKGCQRDHVTFNGTHGTFSTITWRNVQKRQLTFSFSKALHVKSNCVDIIEAWRRQSCFVEAVSTSLEHKATL